MTTTVDPGLGRVPVDWPHRAASRTLKVGALDWHVQVTGRGPRVLLLHGTGGATHSWADLVPRLAEHATLVIPDLPGHGFTLGATPAMLTLPRVASDLGAMLDALGEPAPDLVVGHSAGAPLALRWALGRARLPRRIIGLNPSLIAPPAFYTQFVGPLINPVATSWPMASLLAGIAARTGLVNQLLDSTGSRVPAEQRARYAKLFADPAHVRGAMGLMAAADLPVLIQSARALDVPLTFVVGTDDPWVPPVPLRAVIARAFPYAEVIEAEGGHVIHEARPALAAQWILDRLGAPPRAA